MKLERLVRFQNTEGMGRSEKGCKADGGGMTSPVRRRHGGQKAQVVSAEWEEFHLKVESLGGSAQRHDKSRKVGWGKTGGVPRIPSLGIWTFSELANSLQKGDITIDHFEKRGQFSQFLKGGN